MGAKHSIATRTLEDRRKKIAIIRRKKEFPIELHDAIDQAKYERTRYFLTKVETKLELLLWGSAGVAGDNTIIHYNNTDNNNNNSDNNIIVILPSLSMGLDCDRDLQQEIELAIRFFPHVLSEKQFGYGAYPIIAQTMTLKTLSFVPLLAVLGIELGQFKEDQRGGLISSTTTTTTTTTTRTQQPGGNNNNNNVLLRLVRTIDYTKKYDKEYQQLVDEKCLAVMKQLRQKEIFKKEDIREYNLMGTLCGQDVFPEQRFRFLVDWDPNSLLLTAASSSTSSSTSSSSSSLSSPTSASASASQNKNKN